MRFRDECRARLAEGEAALRALTEVGAEGIEFDLDVRDCVDRPGWVEFFVTLPPQIPLRMNALLGQVTSALSWVLERVALSVDATRRLKRFPICTTEREWLAVQALELLGACPSQVSAVRDAQPFLLHRPDRHPLALLGEMIDDEKSGRDQPVRLSFSDKPTIELDGLEPAEVEFSAAPLHLGTVVARARFVNHPLGRPTCIVNGSILRLGTPQLTIKELDHIGVAVGGLVADERFPERESEAGKTEVTFETVPYGEIARRRLALPPGHALTRQDLALHLREQLSFIRTSCAAYDQGADGEARRLAVHLRVLLHDTSTSRSLLGQLGLKDLMTFPDRVPRATARPGRRRLVFIGGIVGVTGGRDGVRYFPPLDSDQVPTWHRFEDWWNQELFEGNQTLTRARLVKWVANKDGGAHIDPELPGVYHHYARANALGVVLPDGESGQTAISGDPVLAAVRHVAWELEEALLSKAARLFTDPVITDAELDQLLAELARPGKADSA